MRSDLARELRAIVEQVAEPIPELEKVKLRLRGLIRGMDNFMQAAQDVTSVAEKSDYSRLEILNATKSWEAKINQVYQDFKFVNEQLQEIIGTGLRRHSGKGKSLKQRKGKPEKKDYSGLSDEELKKQVSGIVQDLAQGVHKVADDGAFLLQQIDRITQYKKPSKSTVTEELAALWQDFIDFRESFGSEIWAPLKGLFARLESVSEPLTKYGEKATKELEKPPKSPIELKTRSAAEVGKVMWPSARGARSLSPESIDPCLSDAQKRILSEAMERDRRRSVGRFGLDEASSRYPNEGFDVASGIATKIADEDRNAGRDAPSFGYSKETFKIAQKIVKQLDSFDGWETKQWPRIKKMALKLGWSGVSEEKEDSGFKGEPSEGGAAKMLAKGYKYKILLKDKPPLYAKTEKGAKEVQKDYPGSKVVANESVDGVIDDPSLIAEARERSFLSVLPDFDALLEDDDRCAKDLIGEAADLV